MDTMLVLTGRGNDSSVNLKDLKPKYIVDNLMTGATLLKESYQ
jgi:ribonucleotide monophosphatase NagD (HAD superfamily)